MLKVNPGAIVWSCAALLSGMAVESGAVGVPGQGTWETTLQGRDLDNNPSNGFEAFYDSVLNVTWLDDNNMGGQTTWTNSKQFVETSTFYGISGWRLPRVTDLGSPGCNANTLSGGDCGYNVNVASSELAHLFYATLGNKAYADTNGNEQPPGWGLSNTGPMKRLYPYGYWLGSNYVGDPDRAWRFSLFTGGQDQDTISAYNYFQAVHSGDVLAVSEAPIWLTLTAGLVGIALRKRQLLK